MSALAAVAVLWSLAGSPQATPSAEEQRLFAAGLQAYGAGDARAAERAWKEGYALGHDPAFLVRIGEAQEKEGAPDEAAASYRRYLHEAPDAADRADIEQRLTRLAPPKPAPPAAEPTHEFGAAPAAATAPTAQAPAPRPPGAVDAEASGAPEDSGWNRYNVTAWVATAATAVLLGTAAYFGAQASSKEGDANRLLTYRSDAGVPLAYSPDVARQYEAALADGRRDAHDAHVVLLGAAGTAVVAATFFVLAGAHTEGATVALAPTTTSRGALATWRWTF